MRKRPRADPHVSHETYTSVFVTRATSVLRTNRWDRCLLVCQRGFCVSSIKMGYGTPDSPTIRRCAVILHSNIDGVTDSKKVLVGSSGASTISSFQPVSDQLATITHTVSSDKTTDAAMLSTGYLLKMKNVAYAMFHITGLHAL